MNFEDYYQKYKLYYQNKKKSDLVDLLAYADARYIMIKNRGKKE